MSRCQPRKTKIGAGVPSKNRSTGCIHG
jgi:hypothetical protein